MNVSDEVGHFDTDHTTKVNGVLGTQYFCDVCLKGFHNRDKHKCKVWCNVCGRGNCNMKVSKSGTRLSTALSTPLSVLDWDWPSSAMF